MQEANNRITAWIEENNDDITLNLYGLDLVSESVIK
jgi:hypothetical protein